MNVDPIAAEARAVEHGAHAIAQEDGSFRVRSATRNRSWRVEVAVLPWGGRHALKLSCECESGSARPGSLVACWHGALVGRRLERTGWATWESGFWWATRQALERAGIIEPAPPAPRRARGACPVCRTFVTVDVYPTDGRPYPAIAADHDPKCAEIHERRQTEAAAAAERYEQREGRPLDLWER